MSIGTLFAIAASASVLAHKAATNRGRNAQVWSVLAFLFPITLLVLWCLSDRSASAAKASGPVTPAPKAPVIVRPSGWADSEANAAEQHAAMNERGMSTASLAESW